MKDSLMPGLTATTHTAVTPDLAPQHLPDLFVLSTPSMINLMELACHEAVLPHLDDGETSVGIRVEVSHVAAASEGEVVTVTSNLVEVRRNRLRFEVAARCGDRLIGEGLHERAVIDMGRLG